jgi:hypothetical protein
VGHENDGFGAIVNGMFDCGKSTDNSLVVGDLGVGLLVEWYVEVDLFTEISSCPDLTDKPARRMAIDSRMINLLGSGHACP